MLRNGFQMDMLLLIADNQPMGRHDLADLFLGDDAQRKNTVYSLKQKALIAFDVQGYSLTSAGEAEALAIAKARKAKQPRQTMKATPKPAVLIVPGTVPVQDDKAVKLSVLDQLVVVVKPEWAEVLQAIGRDIKNA